MSVANLNGKGLNFSAVNGLASDVVSATSSNVNTIIAIPGLTSSSVVLASIVAQDTNATIHILYAIPSADTLTVCFNTATSASTTAKIAWFVPQY
jgi:hypothetical protein